MKTHPVCCWCERVRALKLLRLGSETVVQPKRVVVLMTGAQHLFPLFQLFRFPHFLKTNSTDGGRYFSCPDSDHPWLSPWLKLPGLRSYFARLFRKAIGDTEILVLIHKTNPHHVAAQLHFAEQLIELGYSRVLIGLHSAEIESLPQVAKFGLRFSRVTLVTAAKLKSDEVLF